MLKKIFASRTTVDANHKDGSSHPVFTIREADGRESQSSSMLILGPSQLHYDPNSPEGNRIWIETYSRIILNDDPQEFVVIV